MKIQFDPNLDFQAEAIASVVDIFEGQETCRTSFTVAPLIEDQRQFADQDESDLGIGNRLRLLDEDILANVRKIQLRNGLAESSSLDGMNFTVEMETGTGKTYVYIRTICELHREYAFTKFIVVVPSVAVKEGVYKALQMTDEHFRGLYENVPFDYFVYDSQKLSQVRNFATSDTIQIMVINIDAFRKSFTDPEREDKANIIHRPHDRMTGSRPIEFIQATNPVVIIDEPQSVDTTAKSREAIASLNPLCTLRYSATHVDQYNMVYRLDSIDAYARKLVKQIEVAGVEVRDSHNLAYIKLLKVDNRKTPITAQVEIDVLNSSGQVQRKKKTVRHGTDLMDASGGRNIYEGYIVNDIYCEPGNEYIDFTSRPEVIRLNMVIGEVDEDQYKRLQIRKTIEEHLDKELRLRPHRVKVLSLFFIDRVANYRLYDEDGKAVSGKYAGMFEEEYAQVVQKPKYATLFEGIDRDTAADGVHDGYFAIDRKRTRSGEMMDQIKDSRGEGTTQADESAYKLIMQDKERLLSFDSKLKFIFSHSALKEGWDNPNVFQICTLNETTSVMKKRQEIGRGLRIAVNQDGERVHGFDVNTLTVMANESYEEFARKLQKEIEDEEGIRFGIVEPHMFASIPIPSEDGTVRYLGQETSKAIWEHMKTAGYVDAKGKVQDALRTALREGTLDLPEEVRDREFQISALLRKVAGDLNLRNADERRQVHLTKAVYLSPEFKDLWDRIKFKTTFRVNFDGEELIAQCADAIGRMPGIGKARFVYRKSQVEIDRGGVRAKEMEEGTYVYDAQGFQLPDIVGYLQNETNLTRRSLVEILTRSRRLEDFKRNPQKFIEQVTALIQDTMRQFIVDGIKYRKIGDDAFYVQELFENEELHGYLSRNMLECQKSVYGHVVYDSDVEREFAERFEKSTNVKVYAKLPDWFRIDTPLGPYNPDWAVLVEVDGASRLYFVLESKGGLFSESLRASEQAKMQCGQKHFEALETGARFAAASNFDTFAEQFAST